MKAGQKSRALWRISSNLKEKALLYKAMIKSQFNYFNFAHDSPTT